MIIIDVQHGHHIVSFTIPLPLADIVMDIIRSSLFIPTSCIIFDYDSGIDEASIGSPLNQVFQWCMLGLGLEYQ